MKQIFRIALLSLAVIISIAPMSDAKNRRSRHHSQSTPATTKWVDVEHSDTHIFYVQSPVPLPDENGYVTILVKQVPKRGYLAAARRQQVDINGSRYKNYTHSVDQYRLDLRNNRFSLITMAHYSNNTLLDIQNCVGISDYWEDIRYGSVISSVMRAVKNAVGYYY
jgi:hypothetical protein